MSEIDPRYEHLEVEERIYRLWENSGHFNPDNFPRAEKRARKNAQTQKPKPDSFCIVMPPPNANGAMHMGHAVFVTLQDLLIRYWRMRGKKTLWLPGADHAGFETQVVFDKKLEKEGRNRFHMDRDLLWQEIWDFTQVNKKTMERQLRKLGASCDWSREKFTLDPDIIQGVYETFEKMYRDNLIYRDFRVVNWCPKHKTALSDLEVKYVERKDPLYYIKYGPLTLATVRPETKFGDTALAVNPKDKRYQKYIGKEIEALGLLGPIKFKVIADEAVDPDFGTGVVKVTPAHDQTDFEIWQRHKSEIPGPKIVIDENGRLTGETGPFRGLKVAEARTKVAEAMEQLGILEKVEPEYLHQIATCYKCGSTLEPMPKPQWFVKMKPLASEALKSVKQKRVAIYPERSKKVYTHWLENIRDWNISRQIIWGIRIPAWFCLGCEQPKINPEVKARLYLVRHGETDWNKELRTQGHKDVPLNETGMSQAEAAANQLKHKKIDLIISSDLRRTKETARILAQATGAEIIYDPDLRERNLGITEGMLRADRDKLYGEVLFTPSGRPPGGESLEDLEKRIWKAFQKHTNAHGHKNVAIVTHGGPIRILQKQLRGWNHDQMWEYAAGNCQIIQFDSLSEPCPKCKGIFFEQDPDVFDTWFSSSQWPFLTLGYPQGKDFKVFYPTNVMETGYDILFFWVSRMIMLGLYRTGQIPFRDVYLHGLVRDKDRQKMSKSKGNVIDPLGVAETYGTDAVRMALVIGNTPGNDIVISEDKIRGYRNFATKVWNIARFILLQRSVLGEMDPGAKLTLTDKKHVAQAQKIKKEVGRHIERFEFHLAGEKAYHYIWHTFADKLVENSKPRLISKNPITRVSAYLMLEKILLESLTMLHPFMPFVTEEIYQKLPQTGVSGSPEKDLLFIRFWN